MNKPLKKYKLHLLSLLIFPLLLAFLSFAFFKNSSKKSLEELPLQEQIGRVAGAEVKDLTGELPLLPNSEVVSVDSSNDQLSVTLETTQTQDAIRSFYDDYLYINNWENIEENKYERNQKVLTVDIWENIIKLHLDYSAVPTR